MVALKKDHPPRPKAVSNLWSIFKDKPTIPANLSAPFMHRSPVSWLICSSAAIVDLFVVVAVLFYEMQNKIDSERPQRAPS